MKLMLGILLASVAVPAFAADLPVKAPMRPAVPYSDWTGFYIGIHGGYGWGKVEPDNFDSFDPFGNPKPRGFIIGGHAGYLMQWGNIVGGVEVDGTFARLKQTQTLTGTFFPSVDDIADVTTTGLKPPFTATATLQAKINALASARARLGFLLSPNLLAYGTGGIGWGDAKGTVSLTVCDSTKPTAKCGSASVSDSDSNVGWVAGAGLEWQFANNWRFGVEYLHYDLGTFRFFAEDDVRTTVDTVRGRLSVRF